MISLSRPTHNAHSISFIVLADVGVLLLLTYYYVCLFLQHKGLDLSFFTVIRIRLAPESFAYTGRGNSTVLLASGVGAKPNTQNIKLSMNIGLTKLI
jgi:hypothetical protein